MKLRIPATSANLGPGFDSLGLALKLYNYVTIKPYVTHCVSIKGEGSKNSKLKVNNIFVNIFNEIYKELNGVCDNFRFEFENHIPFSRGLGSSSAVIVGAIASAYCVSGVKVSKQSVLDRALCYENHPDNIAPAVYGGFTTSLVEDNRVFSLKKELPKTIQAIVVIPNRPMSTSHSRTQIPKRFLLEDLVYNSSRVGVLSGAFFSENWEMLRVSSSDRVHQDRRMKKLKELFRVRDIALENGALMSTLSGSGSTFFNLVYSKDANRIFSVLNKEFSKYRVEILDFDNSGYYILES